MKYNLKSVGEDSRCELVTREESITNFKKKKIISMQDTSKCLHG